MVLVARDMDGRDLPLPERVSGGWQQPVGLELGKVFGEHRLGIHHLGEAGLHQLDGGNNRRRPGLIAAIAHSVVGVFEGQADEVAQIA